GLTCATAFEAEVMSGVCDDILVAYPPVGMRRAHRLAALPETVKLTVALDSLAAIEDAAAAAREAARRIGVCVELDLGMHRGGVPKLDAPIALAKAVVERPPLELEGIAFYPGHVREPVDAQQSKLESLSCAVRDAIDAFDRAGVRP